MIKAGTQLPLTGWDTWMSKMNEYRAWYSGEPQMLSNFYGGAKEKTGVKFWALQANKKRTLIHLPIANDIADVSANLLFAEQPEIMSEDAQLKELLSATRLKSKLREAAEICAAFGGVFIKIDYDDSLSKFPVLSILSPDLVYPLFSRDYLKGTLSYRIVRTDEMGNYWRFFEERTIVDGQLRIEMALFKGNVTSVGDPAPLSDVPELEDIDLTPQVYPIDKLGIIYVPNMLPNKMMPGSPMGASDFNSIITLMDAADEVYTSLIRDIRLGAAHLFVSSDLTPNREYDPYDELYERFDYGSMSLMSGQVKPIEEIQFNIRHLEHLQSIEAIIKDALARAGYSPQTFGYDLKIYSESGSALRIKERKSLLTRNKKQDYWLYALKDLMNQLQIFNQYFNKDAGAILDPQIVLKDSIVPDESVTAVTLRDLNQALAISCYQKVKMIHPEWTDAQLKEEVDRIFEDMERAINLKPLQSNLPQDGNSEVNTSEENSQQGDTVNE